MKKALLVLFFGSLLHGEMRNVVVYKEKGRFGGWPANHGVWNWGNEILVGFSAAWFEGNDGSRHAMDRTKPEEPRLARSLDGGATWAVETPKSLLPPEQGGKAPVDLDKPMDFTHPGFAMTLRLTNIDKGASLLFFSTDKGHAWNGPYKFPLFGQPGIAARTDYIVNGKHDCLVFLTASKKNGREGRPLAVRTTDGGRTWKFVSFLGDEPAGFSIMPSTIRLGPKELLSTVRVKQDDTHNWIEAYRSTDDGLSWTSEGRAAESTGAKSGNPPSMVRLKDGRVVLTYGYRSEPYSIRARISRDKGRTWGREIMLRKDGAWWDIGYPRTIQRPDGKLVTVYYFTDDKNKERYIAATIWDAVE